MLLLETTFHFRKTVIFWDVLLLRWIYIIVLWLWSDQPFGECPAHTDVTDLLFGCSASGCSQDVRVSSSAVSVPAHVPQGACPSGLWTGLAFLIPGLHRLLPSSRSRSARVYERQQCSRWWEKNKKKQTKRHSCALVGKTEKIPVRETNT